MSICNLSVALIVTQHPLDMQPNSCIRPLYAGRRMFRLLLCLAAAAPLLSAAGPLSLTRAEYEDRIHAVWLGQIAGATMGFQFEHKTASVERVDAVPERFRGSIPVDDDWYYEMVAIRAFEK